MGAFQAIPGFIGGSYRSRAVGVSACRTVNIQVEINENPGSKSQLSSFVRPGKKLFTTLPTGPVHGVWANKTRTFWAAGGHIYEVFEDGTFHDAGQIAIGGNPARMKANGNQLLICSAGNVYLWDGINIFQPIVNFAKGVVDVTGHDVTWKDGEKFAGGRGDIAPGDLFLIAPHLYTVASVTDDEHLVLVEDGGLQQNVAYQAGTEKLQGVMPEFIDGYFIVSQPNSKTFRISNLFDGSVWDALDVQQKSGSVDNIGAIAAISGQLALIGDHDSTEIWGDSGNVDFPFARVSGRNLNCGTAAAWSTSKMADGSWCWLMSTESGEDQIVNSLGGEPQRISNYALEFAMKSYPLVFDAVGSTYVEDGHDRYRIDFPTANASWEWDRLNNTWVELGVATPQDEIYGCDHARFRCHVTWPSGKRMHLGGDFASGKIWEISSEFDDDDGVEFPVMRIAPHLNSNLQWVNSSAFGLDCELGTIDPTLVGPDKKPLIPTVSMAFSDDGGRTWSEEYPAALGRAGEYAGVFLTKQEEFDATPGSQTNPQLFGAFPVWRGLGAFRVARTFKVKSTSRQLRAIYNGFFSIS